MFPKLSSYINHHRFDRCSSEFVVGLWWNVVKVLVNFLSWSLFPKFNHFISFTNFNGIWWWWWLYKLTLYIKLLENHCMKLLKYLLTMLYKYLFVVYLLGIFSVEGVWIQLSIVTEYWSTLNSAQLNSTKWREIMIIGVSHHHHPTPPHHQELSRHFHIPFICWVLPIQ